MKAVKLILEQWEGTVITKGAHMAPIGYLVDFLHVKALEAIKYWNDFRASMAGLTKAIPSVLQKLTMGAVRDVAATLYHLFASASGIWNVFADLLLPLTACAFPKNLPSRMAETVVTATH